jgi:hypothetical protein
MIHVTASFGTASTVRWSSTDRDTAERDRDDAFNRGASSVKFEFAWKGKQLVEVHSRALEGRLS